VNLLSVIALIAIVWYPGPQWREARDPSASPRAQKGGVVRFAGSQSPKSHNAYIDNNTYTKMMFSMMYDNLVGIDRETLEFVPVIASRWAISDDGKDFTFVIDERAKWSDGVKITAYDVKWTFDTIMDPKSDTGRTSRTLALLKVRKSLMKRQCVSGVRGRKAPIGVMS
jgi:microcin C transport system substrate-binding protein